MKRIQKMMSIVMMCSLMLMLFLPIKTYAKDTYSTISSVRIKVSDSLRNLEVGDEWPDNLSESDFTVGNETQYEVESVDWYNNSGGKEIKVGDTPRVRVTLYARTKDKSDGYETIYRFSGSYSSSNVRITNGEFVSANRRSNYRLDVVLSLSPAKGDYDMVENPSWSASRLGYASFDKGYNDSGYYEVTLRRDNRKVVTITTDARSLNLYPWMTEAGEYTFSVVTIPYTDSQKKYGKKSESIESDALTITNSNCSNGSGQYSTTQISSGSGTSSNTPTNSGSATTNQTVGWYQSGGFWYFRYPNQQQIQNNWLNWNDKWYHFNSNGQMQTGWFQSNAGNWFYLDPTNGDAKTGWRQINNIWYFFNTTKGDNEAVMLHDTFLRINDDYYYFTSSGAMCIGWTSIKDSSGVEQYYYFNQDGKMARSTTIDGFTIDSSGRWVH